MKLTNIVCYVLLSLLSYGCANKMHIAAGSKEIFVSSHSPQQPVLRGLKSNPLVRIDIYVPAGMGTSYKTIHCTLNGQSIADIEKLEVFFTGNEPLFSATNLIASPTPAERLEIPVNISLQPGWHYLWVSATLKGAADIDHAIEFHAISITDAADKVHSITESGESYKKRMGIALRKAGDEGVDTYRIPGITVTDKGTLIAVYDIRYNNAKDLPGNIDVGMSRSTDGGKTWQPMKIIMDMGAPHENNGVGDPAILFDPVTKKIWVAALWSKGNRSIAGSGPGLSPDETGQFVLVSSNDDGLSWSAPINITEQVKNPEWKLLLQGPGNGIVMEDGQLVFPAQFWDAKGMPHSTIIHSNDNGTTWICGVGAKANTTESQVVESTKGTLMLNMRDNRGSYRSVATTTDFGKTWVEHFTSYRALPDPVCMAGFIKAKMNINGQQKEILLFSNCNSSTAREHMTIKASLDAGESWSDADQLLVDERKTYGYSVMVKIDDDTVGLLYEGIKDLYFVRIPMKEIIRK